MKEKKWTIKKGSEGNGKFVLGKIPERLPQTTFLSLTRGEGLNLFQLFVNQVLTLMIMNQMKKSSGLIYAELSGELKRGRGNGQTMTVWDGKVMSQFRNKSAHGFAMKFFAWVVHRRNTKTYYLTFSANGKIPSATEATNILRECGKFYDGGRLVRKATPPKKE
ncbi:hypothetical protein QTL97_09765 [Sporosarcina thermotolerans]|uniref:Uncharacterized protein n=1 Tax=Sporosarcina thermotolerans TaxID=633404 RepID=A0AAW9AC46_9BACL|nr:hypothetical protein [Sporosarcina thermotolerans]MDW0117223.1 hypothetical protein [Sporosarcina thermotolerans]WHT47395.1 hypothetical protein QNH10_14485 [Sporosarcina thermotolerans]